MEQEPEKCKTKVIAFTPHQAAVPFLVHSVAFCAIATFKSPPLECNHASATFSLQMTKSVTDLLALKTDGNLN